MFLFVLPVTPALLPSEKQEQEQEQEQEHEQEEEEEDAPVCNYSSTNRSVLLLQARPVVAQRNKSGRASSLEESSAVSDALGPHVRRDFLL